MTNIQMKDSGVEWIGEIPKHWDIKRFGAILKKSKKETGFNNLKPASLSFGKVVEKKQEVLESTIASYQRVIPNQIVINPLNLNFDLKSLRVGIVEKEACMSSGYIVLNVDKKENAFFTKYQLYLFDILEMKNLGGGVRQTVSYDILKKVNLLKIPKPEQTAIANYLDHHTSKIDGEVEYLEKRATLLEEFKQSLIFETITKGLDKSVPMKDSGIEWLGEIPEHWKLIRGKDFIKKNLSGTWGDFDDDGEVVLRSTEQLIDGTLDIKNPAKIKTKLHAKNTLKSGDLIITKSSGSSQHIGKTSLITKDNGEGCGFSNFMLGIRLNNYNNSSFFRYTLNSLIFKKQIFENTLSVTLNNLSAGTLNRCYFPSTDKREQKQIADYLDKECGIIDTKVNYYRKKAKLLKEYKQSLIYEAVTGKIEIPREFL